MGILGTGIVKPDPLQGKILVMIAQELGFGGMSREDKPGRNGQGDGDSTADDENQLVWVKTRIGVSQAISQETTEDSGETIGRVPNTAALDMRRSDHSLVSKRLFPPGPPHRHNDQHRWRDTRLEGTENESEDGETSEGRESRHDTKT